MESDRTSPDTQMIDSTHVKAHRSAAGGKGGEQKQAVGRSRGGRNTKIHALADAKGRLLAILLTGGEAHDCASRMRVSCGVYENCSKQLMPFQVIPLLAARPGWQSSAVKA